MEDLFWQAAGPLIDDGEPSAALQARPESTPEIPARHRHQDDRHR
jgi:hypothetical protein